MKLKSLRFVEELFIVPKWVGSFAQWILQTESKEFTGQ